ncbi:MAG: hypothetical protein M1816_004275 [Peltula sp. TS41687]|nr:MAG: hypothetical protein M1816_004275 [Peltula sp. TS41687]
MKVGRIFVRPWSRAAAATTTAGREGQQKRGRGRGRKFIAVLPGNHDLGFASGIQVPVRKRFHAFFGEGNRVDMVGQPYGRTKSCGDERFPERATDDQEESHRQRMISQDPKTYRRIKYPHRPGLTARDPQISELLVDKLTNLSSSSSGSGTTKETSPSTTLRVFSGDDHDYCSVTHTSYGHHHTIPEITVKSISWAMGIRKPGFEMVSLWNPLFSQT